MHLLWTQFFELIWMVLSFLKIMGRAFVRALQAGPSVGSWM